MRLEPPLILLLLSAGRGGYTCEVAPSGDEREEAVMSTELSGGAEGEAIS